MFVILIVLAKQQKQWNNWTDQIPVFGFNSSKNNY